MIPLLGSAAYTPLLAGGRAAATERRPPVGLSDALRCSQIYGGRRKSAAPTGAALRSYAALKLSVRGAGLRACGLAPRLVAAKIVA